MNRRSNALKFVAPLLLGVLFVALAKLAAAAPVADATTVVLRATNGEQTVWETRVEPESCALFMTDSKPAKATLLSEDCATLRELVRDAAKEAAATVSRRVASEDEPLYELTLNAKTSPVELKAPSACEIRDDGELDCAKQELTSREKILLLLRKIHKAPPQ